MRRNGFTMVELIFVIIIIGILSVAAIPKFGNIKDRAKVNSEYSSLSGLQSAITAKMEFTMEDTGDIKVNWNGVAFDSSAQNTAKNANKYKKVLSAVTKESDSLRIAKIYKLKADGTAGDDTPADQYFDVFFIEGIASNSVTGVSKSTDTMGRPDKNDVWVFNTSGVDITISFWNTHLATPAVDTVTLHSGDIKLLDIGTDGALQYDTTPATDKKTGIEVYLGTDTTGTKITKTDLP